MPSANCNCSPQCVRPRRMKAFAAAALNGETEGGRRAAQSCGSVVGELGQRAVPRDPLRQEPHRFPADEERYPQGGPRVPDEEPMSLSGDAFSRFATIVAVKGSPSSGRKLTATTSRCPGSEIRMSVCALSRVERRNLQLLVHARGAVRGQEVGVALPVGVVDFGHLGNEFPVGRVAPVDAQRVEDVAEACGESSA